MSDVLTLVAVARSVPSCLRQAQAMVSRNQSKITVTLPGPVYQSFFEAVSTLGLRRDTHLNVVLPAEIALLSFGRPWRLVQWSHSQTRRATAARLGSIPGRTVSRMHRISSSVK